MQQCNACTRTIQVTIRDMSQMILVLILKQVRRPPPMSGGAVFAPWLNQQHWHPEHVQRDPPTALVSCSRTSPAHHCTLAKACPAGHDFQLQVRILPYKQVDTRRRANSTSAPHLSHSAIVLRSCAEAAGLDQS